MTDPVFRTVELPPQASPPRFCTTEDDPYTILTLLPKVNAARFR
jgi:hypothetical protein